MSDAITICELQGTDTAAIVAARIMGIASKGYLALRSAMAYDSSNEIGELYSGDTVEVTEYTTSDYWYEMCIRDSLPHIQSNHHNNQQPAQKNILFHVRFRGLRYSNFSEIC